MKVAKEQREVQTVGVRGSYDFHLAMGTKIMEILSGQYTNLPLAVMREYMANMMDAYVGIDPAARIMPELHLPTEMEPWVEFKDNGIGMSFDTVVKVYTGYGVTTKDEDNDNHGGFGIGGKVMFAFMRAFPTADGWTVESRFNGEHMIFSATKDQHGMPKLYHLGTVPTDEPNGVTVRGPIPPKQHATLAYEAEKLLAYFPMEVKLTGAPVTVAKPKYDLAGEGWGLRIPKGAETVASHAVIGGIPYPLDIRVLVRNAVLNSEAERIGFDITVPTGSVDIAPSREGLEYSERTMTAIKAVVKQMDADLQKVATREVAEAETEWEAMVRAEKLGANAFVKRILHTVEWRGKTLDLNHGVEVKIEDLDKLGITVERYDCEPGKCSISRDEIGAGTIRSAPRNRSILMLDDVERGKVSRAKQYLLERHAPRQPYNGSRRIAKWENTVGYVLSIDGKDEAEVAALEVKMAAMLGGAPYVRLSEVEMPASGGGSRGDTPLKVLTSRGIDNYTGDVAGIYIRLNGNSLMDYTDRDHARRLMREGQEAGLIPQGQPLLGVPRSRSEVEDEPEMQELTDFLRDEVKSAMKRLAVSHANLVELNKVSVNYNLRMIAKHLDASHPARRALEVLSESQQKENNEVNRVAGLAHRLGLTWPDAQPTVSAARLQVVLDRYPMLALVSYSEYRAKETGLLQTVLDYISQVDRDTGTQAQPKKRSRGKYARRAAARAARLAARQNG